jgi:hypothetical protein
MHTLVMPQGHPPQSYSQCATPPFRAELSEQHISVNGLRRPPALTLSFPFTTSGVLASTQRSCFLLLLLKLLLLLMLMRLELSFSSGIKAMGCQQTRWLHRVQTIFWVLPPTHCCCCCARRCSLPAAPAQDTRAPILRGIGHPGPCGTCSRLMKTNYSKKWCRM